MPPINVTENKNSCRPNQTVVLQDFCIFFFSNCLPFLIFGIFSSSSYYLKKLCVRFRFAHDVDSLKSLYKISKTVCHVLKKKIWWKWSLFKLYFLYEYWFGLYLMPKNKRMNVILKIESLSSRWDSDKNETVDILRVK